MVKPSTTRARKPAAGRKRPAPQAGSKSPSSSSARSAQRLRTNTGGASINAIRPSRVTSSSTSTSSNNNSISAESKAKLRQEFIDLFSRPNYFSGISNQALRQHFGDQKYLLLVPIINALTKESRLNMSKNSSNELVYNLVSDEIASKFAGLDVSARMVYQIIEKAGNKGIWTKDIRQQTNLQQQPLKKIFNVLETKKLIKQVKCVAAKNKKLYMLYDLTPSKEITGGPWYTELEFDHEFINELRTFVMHCVRRLNQGNGVTLRMIAEKMKEANVSRVELSLQDVQQLMQTLAFDYMIEQSGENRNGEALFIAARKITTNCDFTWWEVLCPDFHFRDIQFEDGVVLTAHEPHHHTTS